MKIDITSKKSYTIEIENARRLILRPNNIEITDSFNYYELFSKKYYTDEILSINLANKKTISIGEQLKVDNINYTINQIYRGNKVYYLVDSVLNKSAKYILPFVCEDYKCAGNYLYMRTFYNSYLYWDKYPQYSDNKHLFLCYKFLDNDTHKKLEAELIKQKNYIETIEPNTTFTIFVMEIPEKWRFATNQIIKGRYHYLDSYEKGKILEFFSPVRSGNAYQLLYNRLSKVLWREEDEVRQLERKLAMSIPKHISIESKLIIKDETLKL